MEQENLKCDAEINCLVCHRPLTQCKTNAVKCGLQYLSIVAVKPLKAIENRTCEFRVQSRWFDGGTKHGNVVQSIAN